MPITRADNVTLQDFLPLPVFNVDATNGASGQYVFDAAAAGTTPADGVVTWAAGDTFHTTADGHDPIVTVNTTNNQVKFDFGAIDNAADYTPKTIDLLFTTKVLDQPYIDDLKLTNQVTAHETNSFGVVSSDSAIVQVLLGQPVLNVQKAVVGTTGVIAGSVTGTMGPVTLGAPGTVGNTLTATHDITSAGLAATPLSDTLKDAQGGDVVRFAITVENTGHGPNGAYDVVLHDLLPTGYVIPSTGLNLTVTDGNGVALHYIYVGSDNSLFGADYTKDGIELINTDGSSSLSVYNATSGTNIAVITYDLQLETNIPEPTYSLVNKAVVTSYAAVESGVNYAAGPQPGNLTAQTTVITRPVTGVKTVMATSESITGADKLSLKIGEQVTFQVTETLGEGTLGNVTLKDVLDNASGRFTFLSGAVTQIGGGLTTTNGVGVGTALTGVIGGTSASLALGDVVVNTNALDASATITYTVTAAYAGSNTANQGGQNLVNNASVTANDPNSSGTITTGTASVALRSVAPELVLTKTVKDLTTGSAYGTTASVNATDQVQYRIHLANGSDGNAASAFNIDIKDLLASYGTDALGNPNVVFDVGSVHVTGGVNAQVVSGDTAGDSIIEVMADSLAVGGGIDITFTGVVSAHVVFTANIPNTATFTADTLPDTDSAKTTAGNNRVVSGTASADLLANAPITTKVISASSDAATLGTKLTIGETATYSVTVNVPKGDDTTLTVVDKLPSGMGFFQLNSGFTATGVTYTGVSATNDPVANTVSYTFTGVHAAATGATIKMSFDAIVLNVPANVDGARLTNTITTFSDGKQVDQHTAGATVTLGTLTGHVWLDKNADGVQAIGTDANLAGITVTLLDANGVPSGRTTTTLSDGSYSFKNLVNGSYAVKVTPPSGDAFSPVGTNVDKTVDSIVNLQGQTAAVAVTAGNITPNQNAAIYAPATLGDTVFTDQNANGIQDSGDTGIAGLTVTLLDGFGNPTDGLGGTTPTTTVTDANGHYSFGNLRPGAYEVQFTTPAGDHFSPQAQGSNRAVDSNPNAAGLTPSVTLVSGQNDTSIDAGIYAPVSVSGVVFVDLNDNGVKNIYDTPVRGIEVDLLKNGVATGATLLTDANGAYNFGDLIPGTYSVQVVKPAVDTFSPVGHDVVPALNSIVSTTGTTSAATLTSGQNLTDQNAGLFPPQPKLSIVKTESITTGQAGDIVTYTVTVSEAAGDAVSTFNISIADLLAPGETLVAHSETVSGGSTTGAGDTIVEAGTGFTAHVNQLLAADQPVVVTYQAKLADSVYNGQTITNTAHLGYDSAPAGGLSYTDTASATMTAHLQDQFAKSLVTTSQNGGNVVITGETVTFDLTVTLARGTQDLVLKDVLPAGFTAVSAKVVAEGNATSSLLHIGDVVSAVGPALSLDFGTVVNPGSSTTAPGDQIVVEVTAIVDDNVASGTLITNTGTLIATTPGGAAQETDTSSTTVKVMQPSRITGFVFLDGNCNGTYHVGDPGIAGVTVRLLDGQGNPTGITTTTDSYGHYSFNRLIPGKYEVQVVNPQGTDFSDEEHASGNALVDSDVNPTTGVTDVITLSGGDTFAGANAGLEFNGHFAGVTPSEIGNGMFLSNDDHQVVVGNGNNTVMFGAGGNNIVILDGKGLPSLVELNVGTTTSADIDIVTSCGPLSAQSQTRGSGYLFAGDGGSSTLNGGPGNAYMMGAGSNDLIFGGTGNNVIIGGGSTGVVTTLNGAVTGYTDGDRLIASGLSTEFLYEKGDGVVTIDGGLRAQDLLKISGYGNGALIKVSGQDALYFGGDDLIVFHGYVSISGGVVANVTYTAGVMAPETVVVFGVDGLPTIVAAGAAVVPVVPVAAPVVPPVVAPVVPPVVTPTVSPVVPPVVTSVAPSSQTVVLQSYGATFNWHTDQTGAILDTMVSGSLSNATIAVGDGANLVTAGGYGNVITAGNGNNRIEGGEGNQKIVVGNGNNTIGGAGYTNVITAGGGMNVINGGAGGAMVTVGDGNNTITAAGYSNVITAGNGTNVINGGAGGAKVTVGSGDDTITVAGYTNVIIAGAGNHTVIAGEGENTVTLGTGINTISANGYNNRITVADGQNTIIAGAGGDVVDLGAGSDTVTLAGWNNLLIGGMGHAVVKGGLGNVYQIEGIGLLGGVDVQDFGTANNDVLDLSRLFTGISLTPSNLGGFVGVSGSGSDTAVSVDVTGAGHFAQVAMLRGAQAATLQDLQNHGAIRLS